MLAQFILAEQTCQKRLRELIVTIKRHPHPGLGMLKWANLSTDGTNFVRLLKVTFLRQSLMGFTPAWPC
jgi:hypothetical protein